MPLKKGSKIMFNVSPNPNSPASFQIAPIFGSVTAAAGACSVTLAGTAGKTTYFEGFDLTSGNATVASTQVVTVTGLLGGTLYYDINVLASDTLNTSAGGGQLSVRVPEPLPASGPNVAIVVNVPSLGSGNTLTAVNGFGFQL
jgi:hypothetical protein